MTQASRGGYTYPYLSGIYRSIVVKSVINYRLSPKLNFQTLIQLCLTIFYYYYNILCSKATTQYGYTFSE